MKYTAIFILILLNFSCSNASHRIDKHQDNRSFLIMEYFPTMTGSIYIYLGTFKKGPTNEVVSDTNKFVLKEYRGDSLICQYFWENQPPVYYVGFNIFFWGVYQYKDSSLYIHQVDAESEIESLDNDQFKLLFPKSVASGYSTIIAYNKDSRKIKYTVIGLETITDENNSNTECLKIQIEDSWDDKKPSIGYVWLKKKVGVVKWQRPTGRVEQLIKLDKIELIRENKSSSHIYKNSDGNERKEHELLEGNKFNSDYSRAIYNENGYLIREVFWGSTGEMEITEIEYQYDKSNRLSKEIYHYNKNDLWVSEFFYNDKNRLIEYRSKMSKNDKDYYIRQFYRYDEKKNTFGLSKDSNKIECNQPIKSTDEIVSKLLYSNRHPLRK